MGMILLKEVGRMVLEGTGNLNILREGKNLPQQYPIYIPLY